MSSTLAVECALPESVRLSVPRGGHVLSTVTEAYGGPIRYAIDILAKGICGAETALPEPASLPLSDLCLDRSPSEMAARHICAQWVLAVALGAISPQADLLDGVRWFDTNNPYVDVLTAMKPKQLMSAQNELKSVAEPFPLADLLPYILDPLGPGSRLSVMRDVSTKDARNMRRTHGVYYTPADVAEHMATAVLADLDGTLDTLRILDPACGTGVFLRAILCIMHSKGADVLHVVKNCLFGMDIDPWSVDGSAYVMLHDVLALTAGGRLCPAPLWKAIRRNLSIADGLSVDPADQPMRMRLFEAPGGNIRHSISDVFPNMGHEPNVIIGNPPYAAVSTRDDLSELSSVFTTFPQKGTAAADMHPLFFEQMVRLSAQSAACSMVIPLSVAFGGGQQYLAMRQLMENTFGTWRFSFFDREPHALFGEDVKTRNTIVTWTRKAKDRKTRKMTGPLLKWRGHYRARMLRDIRYTEIQSSIEQGIPKLSSQLQAEALDRLVAQGSTLSDLVVSFHSTSLEHTFDAERKTLFVGGTAYNFLNVFFRPPVRLQPQIGLMSTNTMHALGCATLKDAFAAFAILSSGVAFWLWHIQGDGFHLSRGFLEDFPIGPNLFNAETFDRLSFAGKQLWHDLQSHPVSSRNRGKSSLSFPASRLRDQQRVLDEIIVDAARLPRAFLAELDSFIHSVISASPVKEHQAEALKEVLAL